MAKAGVSRVGLAKLGGEVRCFMADPDIAQRAKDQGSTRAVAAMQKAARDYPGAILAVGNAPTALFEIVRQMERGVRPALVIGVPVGFVNVVEAKEAVLAACRRYDVPAIVALGRKGGSNVAAAICNALVYLAGDLIDPAARGWQ
jgi:precorrin-8X/cobalt-precorrin-8 methylmutase